MWNKVGKIALPLLLIAIVMTTMLGGCGTTTTTAKPVTTTPAKTTAPASTTPAVVAPTQNEIVIGASRDMSGPQAGFEAYGAWPLFKMWAAEVNAKGGLVVSGKKLPVRLIEYDDASDTAACIRNLEKLITQDKVDFLFGSTGTSMLFASAPIANKYKKIMICAEGGATTMEKQMFSLPYVFLTCNYSTRFQMPMFAKICAEKGAKTAFVIYMNDLHGAEYNASFQGEAALNGITILDAVSIPVTITDMNSVIQAAKASNADICCMFCYPGQNILFLDAAPKLNYNPKILLMGPGLNTGAFRAIFGDKLQGIVGEGAWNGKSSAGAKEFEAKALANKEIGEGNIDYWGALVYYSVAQWFGQVIEKAGTLDTEVIRQLMYTSHFPTAMGDFYFERFGDQGGAMIAEAAYAGQIGQWQSGVFEVIDLDKHQTAPMIYPKPVWPAN
jgi:branched-chain amino acid transport system substrate-binding protein